MSILSPFLTQPEGAGRTSAIILGIGCDRSTPLHTLEAAIDKALASAGQTRAAVAALATIDKKCDEPGLLALSAEHGWPMHFYSAARLSEVATPNPSETVRKHMGTPAVSEAAALLAAHAGLEALLLEKYKYRGEEGKNVTVSIVRADFYTSNGSFVPGFNL
uniref:Cobalt-precorrin 5A hydrolase n=1 Tax=Candidatus Kentrum eta TaxID=2126337 RepID=A0A450VFE3_9GAMM|nr:MAG: cobalt-precorrin 5A hydrolase [Candidatus Kentron sp. H]VFK04346.1 MAG: cobalt-precorrin 5A hydrolase [Candidatus Kentron sp. H]VFK07461.1 MAG: cobalt-precorrin 5A hydrolase [Candidatus Kentron sp. H]